MPLTSDKTIKGHLFPDDVLKLKCPPATKKTEVLLIYYYWAVFLLAFLNVLDYI